MINESFRLKAYLLENGINISSGAKKVLDDKSDIWFMDNDYITCTGISMRYDDQYITVNVRSDSKYQLICNDEKLVIFDGKENLYEASVIFPPEYMKGEIIINGKKITEYVNTYTDRIRLQTMCGCANSCKFCNARDCGYDFNKIESLDQAFQIALDQGKGDICHAFVSTNNVKDEEGFIKLTNAIEYFTDKYSYLDIDVMTSPRGFTSYTDTNQYMPYLKYLKSIGVYGIAANIELNSPDKLKFFCPEKAIIGQKNYLKFIEQAVEVFGKNYVRSMLIVGLEPLEETLKGVEKLAQRGCNPVLSPLFPHGEANIPPNAKLFITAKLQSEEICDKHNIKMGPLCKPCSHNVL